MSHPIRIWLEISHHAAFRVGGWASVRADGGAFSGRAGGDRRIEAERAALAGLISALGPAPATGPIQLQTSSDLVAAIPARLTAAKAGDTPPTENLDLWARVDTALAAMHLTIVRAPQKPGTPSAFAAAWAEFARDKAKGRGAFAAPIPTVNLAKAGVPPLVG